MIQKIKVGDLVVFKTKEFLYITPLTDQIYVVLEIKPPDIVRGMGDGLICVQINNTEFLEKKYLFYEKELQRVS